MNLGELVPRAYPPALHKELRWRYKQRTTRQKETSLRRRVKKMLPLNIRALPARFILRKCITSKECNTSKIPRSTLFIDLRKKKSGPDIFSIWGESSRCREKYVTSFWAIVSSEWGEIVQSETEIKKPYARLNTNIQSIYV